MGKISEIVVVSITRESMNITQAGFGTVLILVESTALGNRVEAFSDTSSLLTDDRFGTGNIAYLASLALMGQDKKPEQFKVGCKGTTNRNCTQHIIFDAVATAGTFTITYNGETTSALAYNANAATIEAAIELLPSISSVTVTQIVAATEWTVEFDGADANTMFEFFTVDITGLTGPTEVTIEFGDQVSWPAGALGGGETVTFTITVDGVAATTGSIAVATWSATVIQTALEALSNVGTGNITVEEIVTDKTYMVRYVNDLYGKTCLAAATASVGGAATVTSWYQGQANESWATALTACLAEDPDWYALTTPDLYAAADYSDQLALAAAIEAEEFKIYSIKSGDSAIITTDYSSTPSDIAEGLKAYDYDKSFVTYQKSTKGLTEFPDCAILGRMLTRTPGSSTYKFKTLSGVTAEDNLTTTQKGYLTNKNCNWNETIGGVKIYREGTVGSGEFIDIIVGIDYMSVRMGELIYAKLAASEKVPYTSAGIAIIESLVRTALKLYGVDPGIIDPATILVEVPDVSDVSALDKAARILRNVKFTAQLQGAIHKLYVDGKVYA